jgi:hypothetical protein
MGRKRIGCRINPSLLAYPRDSDIFGSVLHLDAFSWFGLYCMTILYNHFVIYELLKAATVMVTVF